MGMKSNKKVEGGMEIKFLLSPVMLNKQDIVASTCNKTPQCHCMEEAPLFLKRKISKYELAVICSIE